MAQRGHVHTGTTTEGDKDLYEQLLEKSGCAHAHFALQECYLEHHDWRKCQAEMESFKKCIKEQNAHKHDK